MYLWNWIVIEKQTANLKAYKLLWTSGPKLWQVNSPHYTLCISLTPDLRIWQLIEKKINVTRFDSFKIVDKVKGNNMLVFLGTEKIGCMFSKSPSTFPPRKLNIESSFYFNRILQRILFPLYICYLHESQKACYVKKINPFENKLLDTSNRKLSLFPHERTS